MVEPAEKYAIFKELQLCFHPYCVLAEQGFCLQKKGESKTQGKECLLCSPLRSGHSMGSEKCNNRALTPSTSQCGKIRGREAGISGFFLVPVLSTPIRPTSPLRWVDEASVFLPIGEEIWSFATHSIAVKESAISLCDYQLQNQYPHSDARATSLQDCQLQNCFQEFTDIRILYCPCFPFHKGN